jgi:Subtilase family
MTCWPADYPESLTPWSIGSVPPHQVKHLLEQLELILVPNAAVNDTPWLAPQAATRSSRRGRRREHQDVSRGHHPGDRRGRAEGGLHPADWSSFGDWVTCSAVGVGIASTFVPGVEDESNGTTQNFGPNAWAIWSGTSFSAPQIAGTVARLCQLNPDPVTPLDALR